MSRLRPGIPLSLRRAVQAYWRRYAPIGGSYRLGNLPVRLSTRHRLPLFQWRYRSMDKFLASLAGMFTSGTQQMIIDVGANVGDTAILLAQYTDARILAIEGSPRYYAYLTRNLRMNSLLERVQAELCIVGTGSIDGVLQEHHGTARFSQRAAGPTTSTTSSLDAIVRRHVDARTKIVLIKVDVDGADFDCLMSGLETIRTHRPLLFFENDVGPENVALFEELYETLQSLGYTHWHVFDNFGNYMFFTDTWRAIADINRYILMQRRPRLKRTIHYVDVLGCPDSSAPLARRAVLAYRRFLSSDMEFPDGEGQ